MNYRHIYHAGNFADIFKHLMLMLAIERLSEKDKGFFFLDAFAGIGLYDLDSVQAKKTGEQAGGVEALYSAAAENADLIRFKDMIAPYFAQRLYPGSPLIGAAMLRPQDRMIVNELHPQDNDSLHCALSGYSNAFVSGKDAYEALRGCLPPIERRGLVLIDPPFERRDEFTVLAVQMREWMKRWPTGSYLLWYPVKADSESWTLLQSAVDECPGRVWVGEILLTPRETPAALNGCGMLALNPPFGLPERMSTLAPELVRLLNAHEWHSEWLRGD